MKIPLASVPVLRRIDVPLDVSYERTVEEVSRSMRTYTKKILSMNSITILNAVEEKRALERIGLQKRALARRKKCRSRLLLRYSRLPKHFLTSMEKQVKQADYV